MSELPVEKQGKKDTSVSAIDLTGVEVDEDGNLVVPPETVINKQNELFGGKVYDISPVTDAIEQLSLIHI